MSRPSVMGKDGSRGAPSLLRASPAAAAAVLAWTALFGIACGGCTAVKRWAYEGFGRDRWQQPARVVETLGIRPGDRVADLGAGGGYFTFRLAEATGAEGRVYALDVDEGMVRYLEKRARREGMSHVRAVLAAPDDPRLPEPVDLFFTCNTYHHLDDRSAYFESVKDWLRPGGRVAVIDFAEGRHATPPEVIEAELRAAGYRLVERTDFLARQGFLIFTPASQ